MFQKKISPIYETLLPLSVRQIEVPKERYADCDNCHHCQSPKNFRYETKCCDYHPKLPNYIIGAILSDAEATLADGRQRILDKIKGKKGVTPYGIVAPMSYHKPFQENRKKKDTHSGQTEMTNLQCPYLTTDKRCSIYKYRSDICPVFYCLSSSGKKGSRFWNAAHQYMILVERKLSLYALQQIGYPILQTQIGAIGPTSFQLDNEAGELNEKNYQHIWKDWAGKEIAFYTTCYQLVQQLSAEEVATILGIEADIKHQQMQQLAAKMWKVKIPDFIQLDKVHPIFKQLQKGEKITLATGKSLQITTMQAMLLQSFTGTTPTKTVVLKANLIKHNVIGLLDPLLEAGVLQAV